MTDYLTTVLRFVVMILLLITCACSNGKETDAKILEGATSFVVDLPPLVEGRGNFRRELNIRFLPNNESGFYQRTHRKVIENLFGSQYLNDKYLLDNISTIAQTSWRSQWEQLSNIAREGKGLFNVQDTVVIYLYPEYISPELIVFIEEKLASGEECSVSQNMFWPRPNDLYSIEQLMQEWGKANELQTLLRAEVEKAGITASEQLTSSLEDSLLRNTFVGKDGLYLVDWACTTTFDRPRRSDVVVGAEKLRGLIRAKYLE